MDNLLDSKLLNKLKSIDCRLYIIIISSIVFGLICHIIRFVDYIYLHDAVWGINSTGGTINLGRFSLGITNKIVKFLTHGENFQSPFLLGFITIIFVGLFVYYIVLLLDIKSKVLIVLLSLITVSFPCLPSLFNFMFTAPFYGFAMTISVYSVYLFCKNYNFLYSEDIDDLKSNGKQKSKKLKSIIIFFISVCILTYCIGIYQAFLPLATTLLLLYIMKLAKNNKLKIKFIILSALYILCSVMLYVIISQLVAHFTHINLSDYRNIKDFGSDTPINIINKIKNCYLYFILPISNEKINSVFLNGKLLILYYISLVLLAIMIKINFLNSIFKNKNKIFNLAWLILCLITFPISINLIFLMLKLNEHFYSIMLFSVIFYVVFFIWNFDMLITNLKNKRIFAKIIFVGIIMLSLTSYTYCRYDNACYMSNNLRYNKLRDYYLVLISKIKNTPGYKDEYPICYVNENKIKDLSYNDFSKLEILNIDASSISPNTYVKNLFMNIVLGFTPNIISEDKFKNNEEVINMPSFPDYGSIKVIDKVVVVKF